MGLPDEERRKHGGLSIEQYTALKEQLRRELYAELWDEVSLRVGRTVLSKGLYLFGAVLLAVGAWLTGAGKLKLPGISD